MGVCRIIPLGGLGEVGKNMTVFEADGSIVVVDAGLAFPRDEHLGVDLVLPDFTYLREREHMIRGVVLTHGHEDHVGSLPYLMREVKIPVVVATRLTLGLVKSRRCTSTSSGGAPATRWTVSVTWLPAGPRIRTAV